MTNQFLIAQIFSSLVNTINNHLRTVFQAEKVAEKVVETHLAWRKNSLPSTRGVRAVT
jgi:hypothetical protein